MHVAISSILDYSIETSHVSVMNYRDCAIYFIPYDGLLLEELLTLISILCPEHADIQSTFYKNNSPENMHFSILCQYSHMDADNQLNAKYELRFCDTLLTTEFEPIAISGKAKSSPKPGTLLYSAKKCAWKIISQERQALKQGMLKTLRTDFEYES